MCSDNSTPIILDIGAANIKAGFLGDDVPRYLIKNVIGVSHPNFPIKEKNYDEDALKKRRSGLFELKYPIQKDAVDINGLEDILQYISENYLLVDPDKFQDHPIYFTMTTSHTESDVKNVCKIFLEKFRVQKVCFRDQALLSFRSTGCDTGVIIESGEHFTKIVPVYEGFAISHATGVEKVGGRDFTEEFRRLLQQQGLCGDVCKSTQLTQKLKEERCLVVSNSNECHSEDITFRLSDETIIRLGDERFILPENLFNPNILGSDGTSIQQLCYKSIMKCDETLRETLFSNIFLSGGNTKFPGMAERLQTEISNLVGNTSSVKVTPTTHEFPAFKGLSVSQDYFEKYCVTNEEYSEEGERVFSKFFY